MVDSGDSVVDLAVGDWVLGEVAWGEDACHVEDLLVDNLVSNITVDSLVGADPVLDLVDVDSSTGFEPITVFGLKVIIDQLR